MKILVCPAFGLICLLVAHIAWAADNLAGHDTYTKGYSGFVPLMAPIPHRDYPTFIHEWIADLERIGLVNRALPNPYRVALPLVQFGNRGPTLMFTYARHLPGSGGGYPGPLLFINMPLQ
jgi:hypothetical protein